MKGIRRAGSKKKRTPRLFDRSREHKLGLPPGTPVHLGAQRDFIPFVDLIQYNFNSFEESMRIEPESIPGAIKTDHVNWINAEGVHDVKFVQSIACHFDLHPLTQEDIVNTSLRPVFEVYPGYFFFAMKMLYLGADRHLTHEQVTLILMGNTVITFQETPGDVFSRVRERVRHSTGKVRTRGADYLIYALVDSIVDGYYQVVDHLGEKIDLLEDELKNGARDLHLGRIYEIRREILFLRKNIMPVRDLLNKVQVEGTVFQENTKIYLKDLSDHIIQVTESLNLSMEMSRVLIDTYHSMQNQRLNAIMKTLTMISTIFLPLNFIAGVYGMNFLNMPELSWQYGYPATLGAMIFVVAFMLLFFIYKGWLLEGRIRLRSLDLFTSESENEENSPSAHPRLGSDNSPHSQHST